MPASTYLLVLPHPQPNHNNNKLNKKMISEYHLSSQCHQSINSICFTLVLNKRIDRKWGLLWLLYHELSIILISHHTNMQHLFSHHIILFSLKMTIEDMYAICAADPTRYLNVKIIFNNEGVIYSNLSLRCGSSRWI